MTHADPKPLLRAVIYLRLSDARNENGSFQDREAKLRDLAKRLGWTVAEVITENDIDPETGKPKPASAFRRRTIIVNGKKVKRVIRPGFRRILDMLAAGTVNALLAEDLDRTMRDPRDAEDLIDVIEETGAWADSLSGSLKFTAGGTDTERLTARISVAVAHKSSRDTARRVHEGRERQAMHGRYGGGRRPYGFDDDGLTVRVDEAAVIRDAAYAVLRGAKLRGLARDLNTRKVPTVTGNAAWTAQTLRDILLRDRNAGRMTHKSEDVGKAPWKELYPIDVHERVKALLTDEKRDTRDGTAPRWLGSGIYRCGIDGCDGTVEITIGRRAPRYRCKVKAHLSRSQEAVDDLVVEAVLAYLKRDLAEAFAPKRPGVDLAALREERKAILANLEALASDAAVDVTGLMRGQLRKANERAAKRLAEIAQAELSAIGPDPVLVDLMNATDPRAKWDGLTLERQRMLLATVLDVTILPTGRSFHGFHPSTVEITPKAA